MSALAKLFSKLGKEIEGAPLKKALPHEWENYLRNRGVKQEELENFKKKAIKDANYPEDRPLTKEEAAEQFRALGDVPVKETKLSAFPQYDLMRELHQSQYDHLTGNQMEKLLQPKYGSEYSLAGAPETAYEELVLHSPWANKLFSDRQHYTDVPGGDQNIAWLRYHLRQLDDATDPAARKALEDAGYQFTNENGWHRLFKDGQEISGSHEPQYIADKVLGEGWRDSLKREKLFHLDELQSKRHQQAELKNKKTEAKHGYYDRAEKEKNAAEYQKINELRSKVISDEEHDELTNRMRRLSGDFNLMNSPDMTIGPQPDAPFKGDAWKNLGLRRALLEAAERDADLFSWTTGKMQQQRWSDNAGEGTERFYDKYIPNQLMKDLKAHGLADDAFTQIDDPSKAFDVRELPEHLATLISSNDDPPFIGHVAELLDSFENNPSLVRRQFYDAGMDPNRAMDAIEDLRNFSIARRQFIEDPELDMEKTMDFGSDFVPKYLKEGLSLRTSKIPAVRLTPEVRASILEKGFPKYVLPLGAAGLGSGLTEEFSDGMVEEPQEFAAGGLVAKKGAKAFKEALKHLESYKGQGHHEINTEKGKPIQELMMKELGEEADHPMELMRMNYGAWDENGNVLDPESFQFGDILSSKNLTSAYSQFDDDMTQALANTMLINDMPAHSFQIRTDPGIRYIDVESQLKKLYGDKFLDHEDEVILQPGIRYVLMDKPEKNIDPDSGKTYYKYFLDQLRNKEEFPELWNRPVKGYIASGAFALPASNQMIEQNSLSNSYPYD